MRYNQIVSGIFCSRPNRFIAHVEVNGAMEICHVKNTGRCQELLVPGATVYLERSHAPHRKTQYDLIAVEKGDRLINMDAQAPNRVFHEFAAAGKFLPNLLQISPEVTHMDSRFDFCLEDESGKIWVEVKGVTLEQDGRVFFPDAPTLRGVKHLNGLQQVVAAGARAAVVFVVQMENVISFSPNDLTHPAFGEALRSAAAGGVGVYAYQCCVTPDSLELTSPVSVIL